MLNEQQQQRLNSLLAELNPEQIIWVQGFLAGFSKQLPVPTPIPANWVQETLTVVYGSQTGNAKSLAEQFAQTANQKGIQTQLLAGEKLKLNDLKNITHLLMTVSTHGDGEAPENIAEFHKNLFGKKAPQLAHLRYAVLALGDSSYPQFCQTGKEFDERFAALGAQQIVPRADLDVDFEADANAWFQSFLIKSESFFVTSIPSSVIQKPTDVMEAPVLYNKKNPYLSEILQRTHLTAAQSDKLTYHIELDLGDSGLTYTAGDSLGILPENPIALVQDILNQIGANPNDEVTFKDEKTTIGKVLEYKSHINTLTPKFVTEYAKLLQNDELLAKAKNREWLDGQDLLDLVMAYPPKDIQAFVSILSPVYPRLYSIASSQQMVGNEVHLCIALAGFEHNSRFRKGVASSFLNETHEENQVRVYFQEQKHFRLPENPDTAIIMVGPGTGVAPFRAFMQDREATGATGKNWMFFGERTKRNEFLYQQDWLNWRTSGLLTQMDVAFSRDQKEKVYVQHKIAEQGKQIFDWLENGAHFYVCGDAKHMAKDVEQTLLNIFEQNGKDPQEYLQSLKKANRYQRDVY